MVAAVPSVTVVIPCWNAERWVSRAIDSALAQTGVNLDVIVVDDGSSDRSLEIIRSFGDRIAWLTGANQGAPVARNLGVFRSQSEYVLFLDADDYLEEGALACWSSVASRTAADLVLAPFEYEYGIDGKRKSGSSISKPIVTARLLRNWIAGDFIPPCAVIWRRQFVREIGGWREGLRRNQDGELLMRALILGAHVDVAERGLGVYFQHDSPKRVSKQVDHNILVGEAEMLSDLVEIAIHQEKRDLLPVLGLACYRLAYECFALKEDSIGELALKKARQLGARGHFGSFQHRLLAGALGLRRKLLLTGSLRYLTGMR